MVCRLEKESLSEFLSLGWKVDNIQVEGGGTGNQWWVTVIQSYKIKSR